MKGVVRTGHYPRAFHLVWGSALALLVIGLVQVYSVSAALAFAREHADPFRYLREQGQVAVVGLALAGILFLIDYRVWRRADPLCDVRLVRPPGCGLRARAGPHGEGGDQVDQHGAGDDPAVGTRQARAWCSTPPISWRAPRAAWIATTSGRWVWLPGSRAP